MLTRAELEVVERVAARKDLLVITDEIYECIRYDGREHVSPATVGRLRARTVTISGLSKTFSITGWRIGYAIAPSRWRARSRSCTTCSTSARRRRSSTPPRRASTRRRASSEMADGYARKREVSCGALDAAGLTPIVPEGAYYVLADVSRLGFPTALAAAMALLDEAKVATVPGTSFLRGAAGERFVRVCYAKEDDVLAEACRRIRAFRA